MLFYDMKTIKKTNNNTMTQSNACFESVKYDKLHKIAVKYNMLTARCRVPPERAADTRSVGN
jgi:hypothetical protein